MPDPNKPDMDAIIGKEQQAFGYLDRAAKIMEEVRDDLMGTLGHTADYRRVNKRYHAILFMQNALRRDITDDRKRIDQHGQNNMHP